MGVIKLRGLTGSGCGRLLAMVVEWDREPLEHAHEWSIRWLEAGLRRVVQERGVRRAVHRVQILGVHSKSCQSERVQTFDGVKRNQRHNSKESA